MWDCVCCIVFVDVVNIDLLIGFLARWWKSIGYHSFVVKYEVCFVCLGDVGEGSIKDFVCYLGWFL
jgi:hypothetical protein